MTTLTVCKERILSAKMNGTSTLPSLCYMGQGPAFHDDTIGENEDVFVGYGTVKTAFPYKMQDMYTRELYPTEIETVVLENEFLKATFYPFMGGKLASLIDKTTGKDLLYCNTVIRPCNLAIRNAWMSGGIEWNCGFFGHHVHTCDTLFCAKTKLEDGTPVLRMYEYERIRRVVVQMDFFLPEKSRLLFARMRVTNTTDKVVPIYWWSNIAVAEDKNGRVITMADQAYTCQKGIMTKVPIPSYDGNEVTYPVNVPKAIDFFYKIPNNERKFECYIGEDGNGFMQCSTARLKGRKLFVWGYGPGGNRWQNYLTDGNNGRYVELQAGLAYSQYENMPMPPDSTWEWLEGYGAISVDAKKAHGKWKIAQRETLSKVNAIITEKQMDDLLESTHKMAVSPAGEMLYSGSGWGALENLRREKNGEKPMTPHLDFGKTGSEQKDFVNLLKKGTLSLHNPKDSPISYMLQSEWTEMLEKAVSGVDQNNWYTRLQLGLTYYAMGDIGRAEEQINASYSLCPSAWAKYAKAHIEMANGNKKQCAILAMQASELEPNDVSLAKQALIYLIKEQMFDEVKKHVQKLPKKVLDCGRVKLCMLIASVKTGEIEFAEKIFGSKESFVIPDIREGELTLTEAYLDYKELKAKLNGKAFERDKCEIPKDYDYRTQGAGKRIVGALLADKAQKRVKNNKY